MWHQEEGRQLGPRSPRSASHVADNQQRLYGYCFLAKQAWQAGDETSCRAALDEARHVAFGVMHMRYMAETAPERRAPPFVI